MRPRKGPGDYTYLEALSREQWIYFAGIFVGEGCFNLYGQRTPRFRLAVKMCDREVIRDLGKIFGGVVKRGEMRGFYERPNGNRNVLAQAYVWTVEDGFLALEIAQRVLPFLTGIKRRQGEAFVRFAAAKLTAWMRRRDEGRKEYTPAEVYNLMTLGFEARNYAGGGRKAWRNRWRKEIRRLRAEVGGQTAA